MVSLEKSFGAIVDDDENVVYDTLKEACHRRSTTSWRGAYLISMPQVLYIIIMDHNEENDLLK